MPRTFNLFVASLVMTLALLIAIPKLTAATQGHGPEVVSGSDLRAAEIPPAENPAQVWGEIQARRDVIDKLVLDGKLDEIHAATEGLAALGAKLLSVSTALEGSKRARVEGAVNQLPKATDRLHDAADAGNAEKTAAEFKKLDGLLQLIAAQYPPGILEPQDESESHSSLGEPKDSASHSAHHHGQPEKIRSIPETAQKFSISASDFRFEPTELVVMAGVPVALTLTNAGETEHAWVVESRPDIHLHAVVGESVTRVFTMEKTGVYAIHCTVPGHTEAGMVGKLVVK